MKINQAGIDLIKEFEGLHTHAYKCPAGKWTIGYGWTIGVKSTDVWTPEHAEEMLVKGLQQYENAVTSAIANVDRKSTRLNSSHTDISRMPSSA